MKKKLISMLLAVATLVALVPTAILPSVAEGGDGNAEKTYTYDDLYVRGARFVWNAFDKTEEDTFPTDGVLFYDEASGIKLTVGKAGSNAAEIGYGNGYVKAHGSSSVSLLNAYAKPEAVGSSKSYTTEYVYATNSMLNKGRIDSVEAAKAGTLPTWTSKGYHIATAYARDNYTMKLDAIRVNQTMYSGIEGQKLWHAAYTAAKNDPALQATWYGADNILEADYNYLVALETTDGVAAGTYAYTASASLASPVGYTIPADTKMATFAGFEKLINPSYANYLVYAYNADSAVPSNVVGNFGTAGVQSLPYAYSGNYNDRAGNRILGAFDFGIDSTLSFYSAWTMTGEGAYEAAVDPKTGIQVNGSACVPSWSNASLLTKVPETSLSATDLSHDLYAIRIYEDTLTLSQLAQNHFADLASYHKLGNEHLSAYMALTDEGKAMVCSTLYGKALAETSLADIEAVIDNVGEQLERAELHAKYRELYVTGASYLWDAYAMDEGASVASFANMGSGDGADLSMAGTAYDRYVRSTSSLDLGSLMPEKKEGTLLVNQDVTFEIVAHQHWDDAFAGTVTQGKQVIWWNNSLLVPNGARHEVRLQMPDAETNVRDGYIFYYYAGLKTPTGGNNYFKADADEFYKEKPIWLSNEVNEPFQFGVIFDYTVNETESYFRYNLVRDMKVSHYADVAYTPTAASTAKYNIFGNICLGYYAIRAYDRILGEEEMQQNHFVDLIAYFALDEKTVDAYAGLRVETKKALHESFASLNFNDTGKDALVQAIENAVLSDKYLPILIGQYVTFDGFRIKLYGTSAIRACFTLDTAKLFEMAEDYTLEEIGVLWAEGDVLPTFGEDMTLPEGTEKTMIVGRSEDPILTKSEGGLPFAVTVSYANAEDGESLTKAYAFNAYMTVTYKKGTADELTIVQYCGAIGADETVGASVSASELVSLVKNDYPTSTTMKKIVEAMKAYEENIMEKLEETISQAKTHKAASLGEASEYARLLAEMKAHKATVASLQKAALYAKSDDALASAKADLREAIAAMEKTYAEVLAYTGEGFDSCKGTAITFYTKALKHLTDLKLSADGDTEKLAACEALHAEAREQYASLVREAKALDLEMKRYHTKMKNALINAETYALDTETEARLFIFGDSTVCFRDAESPTQGWPNIFKNYLSSSLKIENYAVAGWSFKGMYETVAIGALGNLENYTDKENSRFGKAESLMREGDFVIFASTSPNDLWQTGQDFYYLEDEFGNVTPVEKGTEGAKRYTWTASADEYYHMLKEAIDRVLETGATPILVTAAGGLFINGAKTRDFTITRDGVTTTYTTSIAIPGKITSSVEHYEEVKRILAEEYEGRVALLDYAPTVFAEYERYFDEQVASGKNANDALTALKEQYNSSKDDPTHQNLAGGTLAAEAILEILKDSDCALKNYLKTE